MIGIAGRNFGRVGLAVVVGLVAAGLALAAAPTAAAQTVQDIEARDQLIANQEALLNTYRCMFDVDTQVVPGGCSNSSPVLPAQEPGQFSGIPTALDIAVRDQLIVNQETLLNVYRCQFNIDTSLVPNGCQDDGSENSIPTPATEGVEVWGAVPWDADFRAGWDALDDFIDACGFYEREWQQCDDPEDTDIVYQMDENLFQCEIDRNSGMCPGFGARAMGAWNSRLVCPEGWSIKYSDYMCYHPEHPSYVDWNQPT